jgi:hypothetical protein
MWAAQHNGGLRLAGPDELAHLPHLAYVRDDGADADDVVAVQGDLLDEARQARKSSSVHGASIFSLQHHEAEGTVEHAERKTALLAGDLVVVELHGVDPPAPVLVVHAYGPNTLDSRIRARDPKG